MLSAILYLEEAAYLIRRRHASPRLVLATVFLCAGCTASDKDQSSLLHSKLYADNVAGVTMGSGQTLKTRQATANALQASIDKCAANGWDLVIPAGVYEIDSASGLHANNADYASALRIDGSQQARIVQFHANAPILTVGDPTKGSSAYSINVNIDGLRLQYGTSQNGNRQANALQVGALRSSHLSHIWIGADGGKYVAPYTPYQFPAYRAFYLVAGSTPEFSNTFTDFFVQGAQYRLVDMSSLGTSSVFTNWYCTNGYFGQPGFLSDAAWYLNNGDGVFTNMNFENIIGNVIINGQTLRSSHFSNIHLETIQLTGANPFVFEGGTNRIILDDFGVTGLYFSSSPLNTMTASGTGTVVSTYYDDALTVRNMEVVLQNPGNIVNLPLRLFSPGAVGDEQPAINATNISVDDFVSGGLVQHVFLDPNMPLENFAGPTRIAHYRWAPGVSEATGAVRAISSSYTAYGQDHNPTFVVPARINSFTLTLADVQAAGGVGTHAVSPAGNIVHVRRSSGNASGTLTVVDAKAGLLMTNTTAGADLYFQFDGVRYRKISQ